MLVLLAGADALAGPELDERIGLGAGHDALAGPELEADRSTSGSVWVLVRTRSPARNSIAAGATSGSAWVAAPTLPRDRRSARPRGSQ